MRIDKHQLAAVADERTDVRRQRSRFPQYRNLARDGQFLVRFIDILLENHVRMTLGIPRREDGVELPRYGLSRNRVPNPTLFRGHDRTIVVVWPAQPDHLDVGLVQLSQDPPSITVAEIGILSASGANQCLPALSGRIRSNRPAMLEPHQIENVPALVPRDERIGLDCVRIEHQKSSSSRSSKKPCGQWSTNSPVSSIRSRVALTSPSTCST